MYDCLPPKIQSAIKNLNNNFLYEIRLRANLPVKINYRGAYVFLGENGVVRHREQALNVSAREVEECVFAASGYSIYSVTEQMKECFLTTEEGMRIGLSGTIVRDNGKIVALRNVMSLCIRIPHSVKNCADQIFEVCEKDGLHSCILLSAPGYGKTTILRELTRLIGVTYEQKNILVADERGEISSFDTADADVLKFAQKKEAFSFGLRSMRPDVIITDELQEEDFPVVKKAMDAGLKVIASAHFGRDILSFPYKIFERYVCLGSKAIGQVDAIYAENGKKMI